MSERPGSVAAADRWFYAQDGQRQGPVPLATIQSLLAAGRLQPGDLVWHPGMAQWEPASTVTGLCETPAAPAPEPYYPQQQQPQSFPPHAQPALLAYGVAQPVGVTYAGWGQRLGAWFIDWLILGVIRFVIAMAVGIVIVAVEKNSGELSDDASAMFGLGIMALWYLCGWPYYALMESSRRQATLGKLAVGLQVEDVDGGTASFVQTSIRFFLRFVSALIFGIGFLMPLFTARRQALHDVAANTIITVKPPALPAPETWQHARQQSYPAEGMYPR